MCRYDAAMHRLTHIVAVVVIAAACGGDSGDTTTQVPTSEPTASTATTTIAPPASTVTTATSLPASTAATTTTTTTTTTTLPPTAGALALTRIVFDPSSYVVVTNVGGEAAELGAHWLCVFPSYQQLPTQTLEPGESIAIGLDDQAPPDLVDFVAIIELGPVVGVPAAQGGELALYNAADFGSPAAIVDYVEWGEPGHQRGRIASEAGIWTDGAFIEVPEEAFAISSSGAIGANESDWFADVGG